MLPVLSDVTFVPQCLWPCLCLGLVLDYVKSVDAWPALSEFPSVFLSVGLSSLCLFFFFFHLRACITNCRLFHLTTWPANAHLFFKKKILLLRKLVVYRDLHSFSISYEFAPLDAKLSLPQFKLIKNVEYTHFYFICLCF